MGGWVFFKFNPRFLWGQKPLACPTNQMLALSCQKIAIYLTIYNIFFSSFNAIAPSSHRYSYLGICYSFIHQYSKGFQEWPASWKPQIYSAPGVKHSEEYYSKNKGPFKVPHVEHK